MKKTILCMSVLCLTSLSAIAQTTRNHGYVTDTNGDVVKTETGLCVRTGFWTPSDATTECDSDLIKKDIPVNQVAYVQPVVESTPIVVQSQPTVVRKAISADVLFGFDKFNLTEQGKNSLHQLVENKEQGNVTKIHIVGYTDPIGTDSYNQNLSEKRANSVKNYFINNGFNANNIHAEGKGENDLIVTKDQCSGEKLVPCYAPNRRVEIEFVLEKLN